MPGAHSSTWRQRYVPLVTAFNTEWVRYSGTSTADNARQVADARIDARGRIPPVLPGLDTRQRLLQDDGE
jgi:hypothetical protein